MALTRDIDEWPLLICGPIVRRVTPDEVAVFAATSAPCDVQLQVGPTGTGVPGWVSDSTPTRALGASLHVVLCHLRTPEWDQLSPGAIYEYDLVVTPTATGVASTLVDQPGLLTGSEPLGYRENELPTFVVAPGLGDLNVIHSSCRKPHGGGPDALAMVDQMVLRSREVGSVADQVKARPHQLLLTGDQIYADDVALSMLATLQEAGGILCAQAPEEWFPGNVYMGSAEVRPGYARETFLKTNSTLSSDEAMNHLMFYAEFCAMYVMCWSDELWPRDDTGLLSVGNVTVEDGLAKLDKEQRRELQSFLGTLRRARRTLANTPTMMIFDDHEISDDWNLDRPWFNNSRSNPAQHRVVRNGLLAYTVFQAWGNEPARFTAGAAKALLDAQTIPAGATAPPLANSSGAADVPLDLSTAPGERMTWDWTLPGPEHVLIALDSRTRRDYTSIGPLRPGLLTADELDRQLSANVPQVASDTRLRIVIAPAPVVGHPFVEKKLQPLLSLVESTKKWSWIRGGRAADNEAWCVNRITYQSMLRRLADFGRVVVLSGDVHYAYTNHTAYFGAQGQPPARIVQLCSSASKNAEIKTRAVQEGKFLIPVEGESWLGLGAGLPNMVRLALLADLAGPGATLTPFQKNLLDRVKLFSFFESPAVVPLAGWRQPAALTQVRGLADRNNPNDWRYRSTFIFDDRDGAARLAAALQIDPRPPPIGAAQVAMHAHRLVVGEPNVGQFRIRTESAGSTWVVHRLHYMTSDDPVNAAHTFTEHVAPLSRPTATERPKP